MINYIETRETLSARGIEFTPKDFVYAFMCAIGMRSDNAYVIAFKDREIEKGEKEHDDAMNIISEKYKDESGNYAAQDRIKKLIEYLEEGHRRLLQEQTVHFDKIDLTANDLKNVLGKLLKDRYDDIEKSSAKEMIDIIKVFADKFVTEDDTSKTFQKHFIQIFEPFNCVCTECGREFSLAPNVTTICPNCHHVYTYDKETKKFIY
jgi:hypothetical protein